MKREELLKAIHELLEEASIPKTSTITLLQRSHRIIRRQRCIVRKSRMD